MFWSYLAGTILKLPRWIGINRSVFFAVSKLLKITHSLLNADFLVYIHINNTPRHKPFLCRLPESDIRHSCVISAYIPTYPSK